MCPEFEKGLNMRWTDSQFEEIKRILGKYKTVKDSLFDIEISLKRTVTEDSIYNLFRRRGEAASFYLDTNIYEVKLQKLKNDIKMSIDNQYLLTHSNAYRNVILNDSSDKITKIVVCPDAHHPFVDKTAWKVFLNALNAVKPDVLVIIGDFLDCISISRHPKKPKDEKFFAKEIEAGNKALDEICAIGIKRIIFIDGNHERRFSSYINEKAPELDGLLSLKDKLRLVERGIEHVPYGEFIRIGQMAFTHDVGRCGLNAARQSLQDFGDNLTFGHSHRAQVVYGGTVEGKTHVCLNVGWLGDYDAIDYRNRPTAKREWQHGIGLIYQDKDGVSYCNFVPIINGSCIIDGKVVKA